MRYVRVLTLAVFGAAADVYVTCIHRQSGGACAIRPAAGPPAWTQPVAYVQGVPEHLMLLIHWSFLSIYLVLIVLIYIYIRWCVIRAVHLLAACVLLGACTAAIR